MNAFVYITMFGWIPLVLVLFMCLPPRRAVLVAFLGAVLFLPMAEFKLASGIPLFNKTTATSVGVLLGTAMFDWKRWASFRPHWIDLPMLTWCVVPLCSAVANGLGAYDGFSSVAINILAWGVPYLIGRMYFRALGDYRELAISMFIGGLIYCPLCLWEVRFSPQLHYLVYGYYQHAFVQTYRMGGWRPMVFMEHGLMVGLWMGATAVLGWWLWISGALRRVGGMSAGWLVLLVFATSILCKSTGAIALMFAGMAALTVAYLARPRAAEGYAVKPGRAAAWGTVGLWCVLIASPAYMTARFTGAFDGETILDLSSGLGAADRAQSMETRFSSENSFIRAGWSKPVFGWRNWIRSKPVWNPGMYPIPDGMWVIALSENGLVGLISYTLTLLLPLIALLRRYPAANWADPSVAPLIAVALVLAIYMIDNLMNAMINPVFTLASGALATFAGVPALRVARRPQGGHVATSASHGPRPVLR